MAFVVACVHCQERVLDANQIADDEECLLRDHLMAVHPNTTQPATRGTLLRHFVVTTTPRPAA